MNIGNVSGSVTIENIENSSNVQILKAGRDIIQNSTVDKSDNSEFNKIYELIKSLEHESSDNLAKKLESIEAVIKSTKDDSNSQIKVLSETLEGMKKDPANVNNILTVLSEWVNNPIKSTLSALQKMI